MAQNQVQAKLGKYIIKGIKELSGTAQPKKRSASTVPDQARKTAGKKAIDLGTPAEVATPGQKADLRGGKEISEPTPDDTIIARGERLGKAKTMQKSYDNKKKQLERLERKAEQLSQKASPGKKKTTIGRHKANQELKNVKEKIQHLETSMKDMANRYSIKKKEGGTVVPKPIKAKAGKYIIQGIKEISKALSSKPKADLKEKAKTAVGRPTLKPEQKQTEKASQGQKSVKAFRRRGAIKGAATGTVAAGAIVAGKKFLDSLSSEDHTSFKEAFAKAREKAKKKGDANKGVFTWKGDKFTTEVKKKGGGKIMKKKHGGMTHVGLSPAEEARAGTMSEAKRARYMRGGGPIHTTFSKRATPRTEGREPEVDLFPKVERKKGKKVGKKKQGYKARKDESIAMRVKKKRTKKQLKASRNESYGKWGSKARKKGKINK